MIEQRRNKGWLGSCQRVILFSFTLLIACAPQPLELLRPSTHLVWPASPLSPRIQYLGEIYSPQQMGFKKGFWEGVRDLLLGADDVSIVRPYGIEIDPKGRLWVLDPGSRRVHCFNLKEGRYQQLEAREEESLRSPIDLAVDDRGTVYFTDAEAGKIMRYQPDTRELRPLTPYRLDRPTGIAFSVSTGLLYVSDTANHEIVAVDRSGVERFRFGGRGSGPGQFNFPTDLWISGGRVYVTDALNSRVQIFSLEGVFVSAFGRAGDTPGSFAKPKGVATDSEGHIYVCDALFDAVQIFDDQGQLLLTFGESGSGPGQFWMPSGIFIDDKDTIYVADTYNRRVQVFRYLKDPEGI